MFAKRLQGVDEDGAAVDGDGDDDDDHTGGGGVHRRRFRQRFPPPISAGGGPMTLCFCVFDLRRRRLDETPRCHIYSSF